MAQVVKIPGLVQALTKLRLEQVQKAMRSFGRDVLLDISVGAAENINGKVMKRSGPNAALARYALVAMRANVEYAGINTRTGLPDETVSVSAPGGTYTEPMARILAFREAGGTIHMKDKKLRVPLDPARTGAGFDRFAGVNLKSRIGTISNPFFFWKSPSGQGFLARLTHKKQKTYPPTFELWYVLRTSVNIGPHPNFTGAVEATKQRIPGMLERLKTQLEVHLGAV